MPDPALSEEAILRALNLGGLVKDWGGFEKLVAELNLTGNVTVEHDVKLVGKSGASRQIDVLIRHQQGLIQHLVVIDCKHWKSRVGRAEVDALANTVREVNASRGVLFSVLGFESGAVTQAKADGIDLFTVRELTDSEWGLPGRHIDFFLHIISKSIANVAAPGAMGANLSGPVNFQLLFGGTGAESHTPIQPHGGTTATTVEGFIEAVAQQAADGAWKTHVLFDGAPGKRSFWKKVKVDLKQPLVVPTGTGVAIIPALTFDMGMSILQSRIQVDRGAKYGFVLAVEDRVRGVTRTASRAIGETITVVAPATSDRPATDEHGPALVNGSILTVGIKPFFDFSEVADLQKDEVRDELDQSKPVYPAL